MKYSLDHPRTGEHVLFFCPYGTFSPQIYREIVVIQRLLHLGLKVSYLSCDQFFETCDYKTDCSGCHQVSKNLLLGQNFPTHWLSQFSESSDKPDAVAWTANLRPDQFLTASYEGKPIGDWVRSSVHYLLRVSTFDFDDPKTEAIYRNFLAAACTMVKITHRIFQKIPMDRIIMPNGRLFIHRVFLEMAKEKKIPVVTHEYGNFYQSIQIQFDRISNSYANLRESWKQRVEVPLNLQSLLHAQEILMDRRYRRRGSDSYYTPIPNSTKPLEQSNGHKKQVLCLLSSEFEFNASPDYPRIVETQKDWMIFLASQIPKYPDHYFVVKLHPNCEKSIEDDLRKLFSDGKNDGNYEILWPDTTLSTYDLIDRSDYVMVFWTTAGMEAACKNKRVFCVTRCTYYGMPFLKSLTSIANHEKELREFLLDEFPIAKIRNYAFRFFYRNWIEQSVPFTSINNPRAWVSNYNRPLSYYLTESKLPCDPYLDYLVECMLSNRFPDANIVHGQIVQKDETAENFFFRCLSTLENTGTISVKKKKILVLQDRKEFSRLEHSFENTNRLSLFNKMSPIDWMVFFLTLDGHQVYNLNPRDEKQLRQWAHEYGILSGVQNLNKLFKYDWIFKSAVFILHKCPTLISLGRRLMFFFGSLQTKNTDAILTKFMTWFAPSKILVDDHEGLIKHYRETIEKFHVMKFDSTSPDFNIFRNLQDVSSETLTSAMQNPKFDDSVINFIGFLRKKFSETETS